MLPLPARGPGSRGDFPGKHCNEAQARTDPGRGPDEAGTSGSEDLTYTKRLQLLREVHAISALGQPVKVTPASQTSLSLRVEKAVSEWDIFGVVTFMETLGCRPRSTEQTRERDVLDREVQQLRDRKKAATQLLDEVEQEVVEISREIEEKSRRRNELVRGIREELTQEKRCPAPVRLCESTKATATAAEVNMSTKMSRSIDTRANLLEQLAEMTQELSEMREEMASMHRWQEMEAARPRQNGCNLFSSKPPAPIAQDLNSAALIPSAGLRKALRDALHRKYSSMFVGGYMGTGARLRVMFRQWGNFVHHRQVLHVALERYGQTPRTAAKIARVTLCSWRIKVLERRRRRGERWKLLARRFARIFASNADVELVRIVLLEWSRHSMKNFVLNKAKTFQNQRNPRKEPRRPQTGEGEARASVQQLLTEPERSKRCGCVIL